MADSGNLQRLVSPEPGCTDSRAPPMLASTALFRHNHRRTALIVCGVAAFLVFAMVIVFVGAYLVERQRGSEGPSSRDRRPFCCPEEVERLVRYVNTTAFPCHNFFAYVCAKVPEGALSGDTDERSRPEHAVITGAMTSDAPMGPVGRFLASYFRTCVRAIVHYDDFISSLANAFVRDAGDFLRKVSAREAMIFSATMSVKYSLSAAIDIRIDREEVNLEFTAVCDLRGRSRVALAAAVEALQGAMNATVTLKDTFKLVTALCGLFREERRWEAEYQVTANSSSAFSQEVWNIRDLGAAMNSLGFSLKDVRVIDVQGIREIRHLYDMFSGNKSSGLKGAYLLWHALLSGVGGLDVTEGEFSPPLFKACSESMISMWQIWDLYEAEFLTTEDKDSQAKDIFAAIKGVAREQFKESAIFNTEDLDRLDEFFEKVDLLTPTAISKAPVPVPEATLDFGENLLKAYAFEVKIAAARLSALSATRTFHHRDVLIVEDRYIVLSPASYSYIRTGPPSKSHLPNMALLGQLLAESLWGVALHLINWKSKTAANIGRLQECFAENYFKDFPLDDIDAREVIIAALGLSTVLKALNSTEWHVTKPAWSLWKLSEAQFFYIVSSHQRCTGEQSREAMTEVNVPLMYVEDFAESFGCLGDDAMRRPFKCPVSDVARK
ncbi:hypothetical protein MTO96_023466 [Rhipicephalus appendiculatus]